MFGAQLPKETKEHPTIERKLLKTKGYRRDRILPFFFSEKLEVDWGGGMDVYCGKILDLFQGAILTSVEE